MELKKSPKADLNNKKGLFLEIGLVISLGNVIIAFAIGQKDKDVEKIETEVVAAEEEVIINTVQEQKPPQPVKQTIEVFSDFINVVKNDAKITTEFSFDDFSEDVVIVQQEVFVEEEEEDDTPLLFVEDMPSFQGGDLNKFRNWVQSRLKYPAIAQENNIQGKVTLSFVIEKDGTLTHIEVLQSPDRSLSEEASRILAQSPKWTPGKQRNIPVRVKYILPVDFVLHN